MNEFNRMFTCIGNLKANTFFEMIDSIMRFSPKSDSKNYIDFIVLEYKDGSRFTSQKKRADQQYEAAKKVASKSSIQYAKIRIFDQYSSQYGYLSIEVNSVKQTLLINFKEYEIKHSSTYVSKCLSLIKELGVHFYSSDIKESASTEVLACCIDIRGFTAFCSSPDVESKYIHKYMSAFRHIVLHHTVDTLENIKKSTGDGYILVWKSEDTDIVNTLKILLERLPLIQNDLRKVTSAEPFYVSVPTDIGCGIARGIALEIPGDFYGRPLNLAARLCDKARPNGICIDSLVVRDFHPDLSMWSLNKVEFKGFETRNIWIRQM